MALLINPLFERKWGAKAVWGLIPSVEESLKTGLSRIMGANLVGAHGVFGLVEFFWDLFQPGRGQWLPGLIGFFTHLFLGFITDWVFQFSGNILLSVLLAILIHSGLNLALHLAERM